MREYRGLLVMLLMFNSFDLRSANNTLYEVHRGGRVDQWSVRARPRRGRWRQREAARAAQQYRKKFERSSGFGTSKNGVVEFRYGGWNSELTRGISVDDLCGGRASCSAV